MRSQGFAVLQLCLTNAAPTGIHGQGLRLKDTATPIPGINEVQHDLLHAAGCWRLSDVGVNEGMEGGFHAVGDFSISVAREVHEQKPWVTGWRRKHIDLHTCIRCRGRHRFGDNKQLQCTICVRPVSSTAGTNNSDTSSLTWKTALTWRIGGDGQALLPHEPV